ncbi:MAG: nucleotidyltransferase domain-containing protein [Clostridia bacterium]|nr:nucleotidyltransferase domain-containing protein [Clostridia bacterium]
MCDRNESIRIRDEAYALCREVFKEKLTDCYLYGSFARGDFDGDSDVDIMMVVDMTYEEVNRYRLQISRIGSRLSLKYDITVSIKLQPRRVLERYREVLPFYRNVLEEGLRYDA